MSTYIVRRLLLAIPTLLLVTALTTAAMRLIPGDAIDELIFALDTSGKEDFAVLRAQLEAELGLDVPATSQYVRWWRDIILHGNLGESIFMGIDVRDQIVQRLPVTVEIGILALIVALVISFPIGIYSAMRQDTIGDYFFRSVAILLISLPSFWVGIMAVVFPSIWWGWVAAHNQHSSLGRSMGKLQDVHTSGSHPGYGHQWGQHEIDEDHDAGGDKGGLHQDCLLKGAKENVVVLRHALKNALIPVVTVIGLNVPIVIGGSVIVEQIFGLPGMGRLAVEAAFTRDFPVVIAVTFVFTFFVLLIILITDLSYALLDPRIRYQ